MTTMALINTIKNVRSIHAYALVTVSALVFAAVGFIDELQLAIVVIFFGFVSLIDSLEDLSKSIERVYDRSRNKDDKR